jgi:hypothetical protein
MAVGANHVALRHLRIDLSEGSSVGDHRRDAARLGAANMVSVESARSSVPTTVSATVCDLDHVIQILQPEP